jgi:hypothetical protein
MTLLLIIIAIAAGLIVARDAENLRSRCRFATD